MVNDLKNALEALKNSYLSTMPNGFSQIKKACLGNDTGFLHIGMIKEDRDCPNSIRINDRAYGSFTLFYRNNEFILTRSSHSLTVNPTQKNHALSHKSVSYRKIKANDINSLVTKFNKYLTRFMVMAKEEVKAGNLYRANEIRSEYLTSFES